VKAVQLADMDGRTLYAAPSHAACSYQCDAPWELGGEAAEGVEVVRLHEVGNPAGGGTPGSEHDDDDDVTMMDEDHRHDDRGCEDGLDEEERQEEQWHQGPGGER
jgi:hypothetical protein